MPAALLSPEQRASPGQHALCGKRCFLLTPGTNSVWHVERAVLFLNLCHGEITQRSPGPPPPGFFLGGVCGGELNAGASSLLGVWG